MIRVSIFSDIRIYCEGLSDVLSGVESIEIVGAHCQFPDAIEKIQIAKPDIVLLDMTMNGCCRNAQRIIETCPRIRIVGLAASEERDDVIKSAEIGITGYVAREASLDELIETLKAARQGEFHYPPKVAAYIFNQFREVSKSFQRVDHSAEIFEGEDLSGTLTGREKQITQLMSEGLSNKQIARKLSIEVSTVKNHVHNILVKLQVKNRAQVASVFYHLIENQGSRSFGLDLNNHLVI